MRSRVLLVACLALLAPAARAVIIYGVDGTINTTAPGNGAPWDHVGTIGSASGVYLGEFGGGYWVITAAHVGLGSFVLNNTTYTAVGGSGVQISGSDLFVYRIASAPTGGLTNLTLSSVAPSNGASVTMIGAGLNRGASEIFWSVNDNGNTSGAPGGAAWTWTSLPNSGGANFSGYAWGSGNTMRWGTNVIAGTTSYNVGTGSTSALTTTFSPISGEAQGATGDSGGAMFYFNGSSWELAGIMGAIGAFNSQPGSVAVLGDITAAVNIASYNSAIFAAIPEPTDVALWVGALAAGAAFWQRRRARA